MKKQESVNVTNFKKCLKINNSKKVKEILKHYMESSYFDENDYCHLTSNIVTFKVYYEPYWLSSRMDPFDYRPDAPREMIYVYTDDDRVYRLSSRTVKKYIRTHKNIANTIFN